jgi:uncharacterized protein DUF1552
MIITKMSLDRRTFLRGVGATIALPLLDAMAPAMTPAVKAASSATRLGFVYVPNGIILPEFLPKTVGGGFEMPRILKALSAHQDRLLIVSGLANAAGDPLDASSGPHSRVSSCWLNGMRARRTEGADIQSGTTIDQFAARELGKVTPLGSLELALEPNFMVGNCEGGYSCAYINTMSWRTPTMPLPMETNPRAVFERLFGEGGGGQARLKQLRLDRSLLDSVSEDLERLKRSVGTADRRTVDDYLDAVRDVEQRIQQTEQRAASSPEAPAGPLGIPDTFEEHATLMFDLLLLAYQADITRVSTFQIGRELSLRSYPFLGVPEAHHDISHHGERPEAMEKCTRINEYHMKFFAGFIDRMAATPDGDGSLLDHSMIVFGASMGNSNVHSPHNLPIAILGGGRGQLKSNRHVKATFDTPFMNLGLTLLDKVDVHVDKIGDSTGRLTDI